jgi:hypothetical protein
MMRCWLWSHHVWEIIVKGGEGAGGVCVWALLALATMLK